MGTESDTIRAFIAVEMPEAIQEHLAEIQSRLRRWAEMAVVRWVDPRQTHITLKFLGDVEVARLKAVSEALGQVASATPPFTATLGELGVFPNIYRPRVLWVGLSDPEGHFRRLARAVEQAMRELGFAPESHGPFVPHITLGRVGRRVTAAQRKALGEVIGQVEIPTGQPVSVDHIVLMRSVLTPDGPIYTRLSHHRLGASS